MTDQPSILADIEAFCARHDMAESTFGRMAASDWKLIADLRGDNRSRPRRLYPETEARVRMFMQRHEAAELAAAA